MKRFGTIATLAGVLALVGCDEATVFNNLSVTLADKTTVVFDLSSANNAMTKTMVEGDSNAASLSERSPREVSTLTSPFRDPVTGLELTLQSYGVQSEDEWVNSTSQWSYGRTTYTLKNTSDKPLKIAHITVMDGTVPLQKPQIIGDNHGAVLFGELPNNMYIWGTIEHPMAHYNVKPGADAGERFIPAKTTYTVADLTNRSETRGVFDVPITVTELPVSITITQTNGDIRTNLYAVVAQDPTTNRPLDADIHDGFTGNTSTANTYTLNNLAVGQTVLLKVAAGTNGNGTVNGTITLKGATSIEKLALPTPPTSATVKGWAPIADTLLPGATMTISYTTGFFEEQGAFRRVFNDYLNTERTHPNNDQCKCFFCKSTQAQ